MCIHSDLLHGLYASLYTLDCFTGQPGSINIISSQRPNVIISWTAPTDSERWSVLYRVTVSNGTINIFRSWSQQDDHGGPSRPHSPHQLHTLCVCIHGVRLSLWSHQCGHHSDGEWVVLLLILLLLYCKHTIPFNLIYSDCLLPLTQDVQTLLPTSLVWSLYLRTFDYSTHTLRQVIQWFLNLTSNMLCIGSAVLIPFSQLVENGIRDTVYSILNLPPKTSCTVRLVAYSNDCPFMFRGRFSVDRSFTTTASSEGLNQTVPPLPRDVIFYSIIPCIYAFVLESM